VKYLLKKKVPEFLWRLQKRHREQYQSDNYDYQTKANVGVEKCLQEVVNILRGEK
jgi:hypothetical protein